MLAGTHRVAPEVAARVLEHEASYANGRTVIKKGGNPPPRKVSLHSILLMDILPNW
jgi:hypothetical protein